MAERPRTWGFRLSWIDAALLALTPPLTWFGWHTLDPVGAIIPFAVGHFFLFCNVFRIHRTKELGSAGIAVPVWFGCAVMPQMAWWWPFAWMSPLTLAVIVREMRGPWYHGIYVDRINPRLAAYLDGTLSGCS